MPDDDLMYSLSKLLRQAHYESFHKSDRLTWVACHESEYRDMARAAIEAIARSHLLPVGLIDPHPESDPSHILGPDIGEAGA